jgi:putative transposase
LEIDREKRQNLILSSHSDLSIRQQCELLNINRSSLYYKAQEEGKYNIKLMNLIDEEYTRHPYLGIIKMTKYLHELGYQVNEKRVRRLTRAMGILAVYPQKKNLSIVNNEHKIYPYLLKDVTILKPNQVWSADITYIRLLQGYIYLIAILDWYSRFVLSWEISNTLDVGFCVEALEKAILQYKKAEIFNTDQGSQFTSKVFTSILLNNGMKISMDGKGRVFDNIFTERLWRTVKYEEVYINAYRSVVEAKDKLGKYLEYYNYERMHQALNYKRPANLYFERY